MNIRALLLVLFVLTSPESADAQTNTVKADKYVIELSSASAYLSQQTINKVFQDELGFIWILTQEGLNKFDGSNVTSYSSERGNEKTLSHPIVTDITQDHTGTLWIGTLGGGLNEYVAENDTFRRWTSTTSVSNDRPISNSISTVTASRDGNVWVGYSGTPGFSLLHVNDGTFKHYFPSNQNNEVEVTSFLESENGKLYIGFSKLGLFVLDRKTGSLSPAKINGHGTTTNHLEDISALLDLGSDKILVTSSTNGAYLYKPSTGELTRHQLHMSTPADSANYILSAEIDNQKNVWFGTSNGVAVFSLEGETTWLNRASSGLPDDQITAITQGRSGTIWIGTYNGLAQGIPSIFQSLKVENGALMAGANAFAKVGSSWWIGTESGIEIVDLEQRRSGDWLLTNHRNTLLSDKTIMSLQSDGRFVWAGTLQSGLYEIDTSTENVTHYIADREPESISANGIPVLHLLNHSSLLVGTYGGGLDVFDIETKTFRHHRNANDERTISDNRVLAITPHTDSSYWIATENGLNLFESATGTFKRFHFDRNDESTLPSNTILSLAVDKDGFLWVGTRSGGLVYQLAKDLAASRTSNFHRLESAVSVPSKDIYSIIADEANRLWISSNAGLTKIDADRKSATTYDMSAGLQGPEFNHGAAFKDRKIILFGGQNGLNIVESDNEYFFDHKPELVITNFKLLNETVYFGKPYSEIKNISLDNDYQFASISFAALYFWNTESLRYRYMIQGIHEDWIDLGNSGVISISGLSHGSYKIVIDATNPNGEWQNYNKSFSLNIAPPFWLTKYAFSAYFLIFLSLALFIYRAQRAKSHREAARRAELEQRVIERTKDLQAARIQAEQATRAKSDFLAAMSHEIRTPMHGVLGMTDLLLRSNLSTKQKTLAKTVRDSGESLLTIIDSILDYSKLEAGKLELSEQNFDAIELIDQLASLLMETARKQNTDLHVVWRNCDNRYLSGDRGKIRQILINLVGNAIKFTKNGTVKIQCDVRRQANQELGADRYICSFDVEDTGIGIPENKLNTIFDVFTQADASTTREYGGTGLGLSISRELSELMGAKLSAISEPGKGSTFSLQIPLLSNAPAQDMQVCPAEDKIIVCDDESLATFSLKQKLKALNTPFETTQNPKTLSYEGASSRAVFVSSTNELFSRSKADVSIDSAINWVIFEPSLNSEKIDESRDPLLPPFSESEILQRLGRSNTTAPNDVSLPQNGGTSTKLNVLLVEDVIVNQQIATNMLDALGHQTSVANNGLEAIKAFNIDTYDIIFMDCQMPEMDGYEATREIRRIESEKGLANIPIIALTAGGDENDVQVALNVGMNDFVRKPFTTSTLEMAIAKHFGEPAPSIDLPSSGGYKQTFSDEEIFDEETIANLVGLSQSSAGDLLKKLFDGYANQFMEKLVELEEAYTGKDTDGIRKASHAIKSMSANMGDLKTKLLAETIEISAKPSDQFDTIKIDCNQLRTANGEFLRAFEDRFM